VRFVAIEASISPRSLFFPPFLSLSLFLTLYLPESVCDLREPPGKRSLLESQCEISGCRLLALRLVGRSIRCTYYQQDSALCLPLSRFVAFLRASVAQARREKKKKKEKASRKERRSREAREKKKIAEGEEGALRSLPSRGQLPSPVFTCLRESKHTKSRMPISHRGKMCPAVSVNVQHARNSAIVSRLTHERFCKKSIFKNCRKDCCDKSR